MAYSLYSDRLKKATDLATKATQYEASLATLSPLTSPLTALHKAFPLYIAAAEHYSLLLSAKDVPEYERANAKKRWRLVLERAEKVKKRIEDLGGHVGKVGAEDEVEEAAVVARGGNMNGVKLEIWRDPSPGALRAVGEAVEVQPELAKEQEALDPEWAPLPASAWDTNLGQGKWVVRQGPGADCSVVAGLGACLEHNSRWNTSLAQDAIWPRPPQPQRPSASENGKHVIKLLLNGAWRSVVIDHLLPRTKTTHLPLHATTHLANAPSDGSIGPAWIPLLLKGYYKAHGGYSLAGSNPAPDVYNLTGWIPERIGLKDGFQREKEYKRIKAGWDQGDVIVTLGTGSPQNLSEGLIPFHAYAVLDITEDANGERLFEVYDPGTSRHHAEGSGLSHVLQGLSLKDEGMTPSGISTKTWDTVCAEFETLSLNWNPARRPVFAKRHWSWPKPIDGEARSASSLRYKLDLTSPALQPGAEIWILLSQHIANKDRASDDIALHVQEEHQAAPSTRNTAQVEKLASSSPYSNAVHVLYRHTIRKTSTSLIILPLRDRGLYRTDFTLQAFAPTGVNLSLERVSTSLPFSASLSSSLTTRNAGGHAGRPSWIDNPQYKLVVSPSQAGKRSYKPLRIMLQGDKEMAWNAKLLWGKGELAFDWGGEASLGGSGAYSYGMAYVDIHDIEAGTYTLAISAFEPRQMGRYTLSVESALPVSLAAIPAEGAGLYSRTVSGVWTQATSGGRPSGGSFELNPRIEITLPRACSLMARAILPAQEDAVIPLNATLFKRGRSGTPGEQIATSGPYSDTMYGVLVPKTKVETGVYVLVISPWERGMGLGQKWEVRIWADGPLEVELAR